MKSIKKKKKEKAGKNTSIKYSNMKIKARNFLTKISYHILNKNNNI